MGSTPQADVPGNVYYQTIAQLPSRASNAADAQIPIGGHFNQAVSILSAWIVPTASQAGSATNYAEIDIIDVGTGSAGTTVLASLAFSASTLSVDSGVHGSFTLGATASKASAHGLALSYASKGNGIALVAHAVEVAYRYL